MQKCILQRNASRASSCAAFRTSVRPAIAAALPLYRRRSQLVAHASSATEQVVDAEVGQIQALDKDTFYPFLEEAGDTLVVVDFYTDWCGPCKMIYPELVKMAAAYEGRVLFRKVNCNKTNKELGVKLAIKVAPTFHLYKRSQKVAEMTGAKVDKLKALINKSL